MWQTAVGKERYKKIWIEDGILRVDNAYAPLWPFTKPELPTEFANKVIDIKSAIKFELRYAPLGYGRLLVEPKPEWKQGDPLEWVLKQAKFVKLTLELIYALTYQDGNHALRQFRYLNIKMTDSIHPAVRGGGMLTYPGGAYNHETMIPVPRSEAEALRGAPHIIETLVNANTENIRQKIVVHYKDRLGSVLFYNALIEAIWSMVGDLAIKAQQGHESGYFLKCEWCRTPFLATDKRQKFCPRPEWAGPGESLCSLGYRQHKVQVNKHKLKVNKKEA